MEMWEDAIRRGLELLRSPEHAWEDRSRVSRLSPVILTHPSNFNYFLTSWPVQEQLRANFSAFRGIVPTGHEA